LISRLGWTPSGKERTRLAVMKADKLQPRTPAAARSKTLNPTLPEEAKRLLINVQSRATVRTINSHNNLQE
jgi:hypothetical protein